MLASLFAAAALGAPALASDDATPGTFRTVTSFVAKDQVRAAKHGVHAAGSRMHEKREEFLAQSNTDRAGHWHSQADQDRSVATIFDHKRNGFFVGPSACDTPRTTMHRVGRR